MYTKLCASGKPIVAQFKSSHERDRERVRDRQKEKDRKREDENEKHNDAHKWNVLNRRFRSFAEGDGRRVAPRFHFVDTFDPGATTSKADGATTSPIDIL